MLKRLNNFIKLIYMHLWKWFVWIAEKLKVIRQMHEKPVSDKSQKQHKSENK